MLSVKPFASVILHSMGVSLHLFKVRLLLVGAACSVALQVAWCLPAIVPVSCLWGTFASALLPVLAVSSMGLLTPS